MTRRDFLLVATSAVVLGACGSGGGEDDPDAGGSDTVANRSAVQGDIALLNSALEIEQRQAAAYALAIGMLKGTGLRTARDIAEHEREHAAEIERLIRDLGGRPAAAKGDDEWGFPALETAEDALQLALALEHDAVAAYIDALPKLSEPELRGTAATIVTSEGQHVALLHGALGRPRVREAFVVGRKAA